MHKIDRGARMNSFRFVHSSVVLSIITTTSYYLSDGRLGEQSLLPPVTPLVGRRVPQLANASDVQVLHRRVLAIQVKVRHTRGVGVALLRESRDVLLQRNGDSRVRHAADWAGTGNVGIVESVGDVEAVERGRGGEQVGVGLVLECLVEVEGVAGEAELGDESRGTVDVVGVALGLGAVEDCRVQGGSKVVENLRVGTDGGNGACDLSLDVGGVVGPWWSEEKTLSKC